MMRWVATAAIVALMALDVFIPGTPLGRRGTETLVRADQASAFTVGSALPALDLVDLDGKPIDFATLLGRRVLITFERSVDW